VSKLLTGNVYDMPATNTDTTHASISNQIMKTKNCTSEFCKVRVEEVNFLLLLSINNNKPPESGNLDINLLRIIADDIATPICHILHK
jgi:hypothetical protein